MSHMPLVKRHNLRVRNVSDLNFWKAIKQLRSLCLSCSYQLLGKFEVMCDRQEGAVGDRKSNFNIGPVQAGSISNTRIHPNDGGIARNEPLGAERVMHGEFHLPVVLMQLHRRSHS